MKIFLNFKLEKKFLMVIFLFTISALFSNVLGQVEWNKYGGNPVLQAGASGTWDDVGLPSADVLIIGTTYHMWYTGNDGTNMRIGHATSPDGITWTKDTLNNPVLDVGAPGTWDDYWVYFPKVVLDGLVYHMWYTGDDGPPTQNESVGHATSLDGISWTKDTINPVMTHGPSGSWDDEIVGAGFASLEGSTFYIWYDGGDGTYFRIGQATSTDGGTTWVKDLNNPVLDIGSSTSWDYPRVQVGSITYNSNTSTYYMYIFGGDMFSWEIGYATSSNINGPWTKNPTNPNFTTTPSAWDSYFVASPCVIYDINTNTYKMWYNGSNAPGGGKIGLATSDVVVPVELTSLTAEAMDQKVILRWSTATELNNNGFEIQRKIAESDFATVGFVRGEGTTTNQREYSFVDKDLVDGKYFYRLKQIDYNGTYEYSNVIEVDVRSLNEYALEQNYPNPFNPITTIGYVLKEKSNAKIILLNAIGEEVTVLVNEEQDKGFHKVDFNASNLPSGVYFYRLQAESFFKTKKMILSK